MSLGGWLWSLLVYLSLLWCRFAGRRSLVAVSLGGWLWSLLVYLSLLWCRFVGRRSLVAVSLGGWLWSLLVYLSLLWVFIESMLWSVTVRIKDLFYLDYVFEFYCIQFLLKLWWDVYFKVFENYSAAVFFNLNKVLLIWWRCVTPLRALIIIIFLLENDMWGLGCYTLSLRNRMNFSQKK